MRRMAPCKVQRISLLIGCRGKGCDLVRLGSLVALHDIEVNGFAFLQALVAVALNSGEVDENVRAAIVTKEAKPFCIVEPRYSSGKL